MAYEGTVVRVRAVPTILKQVMKPGLDFSSDVPAILGVDQEVGIFNSRLGYDPLDEGGLFILSDTTSDRGKAVRVVKFCLNIPMAVSWSLAVVDLFDPLVLYEVANDLTTSDVVTFDNLVLANSEALAFTSTGMAGANVAQASVTFFEFGG